MKLYLDKRLKDPTYYGQQGFRNGKKVTSKNIKKGPNDVRRFLTWVAKTKQGGTGGSGICP